MSTYNERLAIAMKRAGATPTLLAKELGLSYQAVKKVVDGLSSAFNAQNHDKAAAFLAVSSSWLANDLGPMVCSGSQPARLTSAALFLAEAFDALPRTTNAEQDAVQDLYWKLIAMMKYGDDALASQPSRQLAAQPIGEQPRKS